MKPSNGFTRAERFQCMRLGFGCLGGTGRPRLLDRVRRELIPDLARCRAIRGPETGPR